MKVNKKKKQSCLYKQKAIHECIKQVFIYRASMNRTTFWADDRISEIFELPKFTYYGYDVLVYSYKFNIKEKKTDEKGLSVKVVIIPIYHKSKVVKTRRS